MIPERSRIKTAERCLGIIEYVAHVDRPVSNKELAAEFETHPSTIHHIVTTLLDLGYLMHAPGRLYVLGPRSIQLAQRVGRSRKEFVAAYPIVESLYTRFNEDVYLDSVEPGILITAISIRTSQVVRVSRDPAEQKHAEHATASGKVLLAFGDPKSYQLYASRALHKWTEHSIVDVGQLNKEIAHIQQHGYAEDREERFPGVRCLAVPIFDFSGTLRGVLSFSLPSYRMTDVLRYEMLRELKSASKRIASLCFPTNRANGMAPPSP